MDRNKCKVISAEIQIAIDQILKKHNLTKTKSSVQFDSTSFNYTIKSVELQTNPIKVDKDDLKFGLAKPGTKAFVMVNGIKTPITIISAARSKYTFQFANDNGRYAINFEKVLL